MKIKMLIVLSVFLASCSKNTFYVYLDGKETEKEGFYEYTPSVLIDNYSNTFSTVVSRFSSISFKNDSLDLKFRFLEPLPEKAKEKIIAVMPGNQGVWLLLMPTVNLLLNEGYHIVFIDYYGEENGNRADKEKDWGEGEIDELVLLTQGLKTMDNFKEYKIGFFGSSLGSLVGLAAMSQTDNIDCYVGEGMPVNPRRSAENVLDESFWAGLFVDLDDYDELINKYDPKNNLENIDPNKAIYFFWGDDDDYYFEEDWNPISDYFLKKFPKGKIKIFEDAIHSNRLGNKITPQKFDEINQSIIQFFNENL